MSTIVDSASTSSTYPTTEVQKEKVTQPADASEEGQAEVESVDTPSFDTIPQIEWQY